VYRVGVWVRLGTATNFCVVVNNTQAWNTVGGKAFNSSDGLSTSKWTHVSFTFTGPSTGNINLHIGGHSESITQQTAGTVFVWNWEVTTGNSTWIGNIDDEVRLPGSSILTSRGLLGLGTTSPSARIHISSGNGDGDGTYYSQIRIDGTGTYPDNIAGISLNPNGAVQSHIRFLENGSVKAQLRFNSGNSSDNKLKVYSWTTNSDFFTWDCANGNIGIGTTSPSAKLNVSGISSGTSIRTDHTASYSILYSYINGASSIAFDNTSGNLDVYTGGTTRVRITNNGSAETPTSYMKIAQGGIIWGGNNSGKEINSCQISAGFHQANSMNLVGMSSGTGSSDRRIDFWVEGGAFFRGTVTATGDVVAYGSTSDIRLKKNIQPILGAIESIKSVNGYTFQWNDLAPEDKRNKTEYGVIAQEVESAGLDLLIRDYVRPVNRTGGDDTPPEVWKSVQYEKFVPILIEAIKEQQVQIEDLKQEVQSLKNK
jgi:hypothetical protein